MKSSQARLALVYTMVVLIWSTTPLAIKFSVESLDFIQAVALRMWFSLALCIVLLKCFSIKFVSTPYAWYVYASGVLAICGAMLCVYFAAQVLSSGLIAVVWGLTPIVVSVYSYFLLPQQGLNKNSVLSMLMGVAGLYVIFAHDIQLGSGVFFSLLALLLGVNLHSVSSVMLQLNKGQRQKLHPLVQTTGALILAAPIYVVLWLLFAEALPSNVSFTSISATLYLSVFGSVIGFVGYFYLLNNLSAASVALVTLITPVLALVLGASLAGEVLSARIFYGSSLIMLGLVLYQASAIKLLWNKAKMASGIPMKINLDEVKKNMN